MATDEHRPSTSWWQTLPGMLTAFAGVITAIAGLVIALNQAGVVGRGGSTDEVGGPRGEAPAPAGAPRTGDSTADRASTPGPEQTAQILQHHPVRPAAVTLGEATLTVLEATSRPRAPGTRTLEFTVRMLNDSRYPMNFWDDSFRLLVDGIPRAPVGGLNRVLQGRSAAEGAVVFLVPDGPETLVLRLTVHGESADLLIGAGEAGR